MVSTAILGSAKNYLVVVRIVNDELFICLQPLKRLDFKSSKIIISLLAILLLLFATITIKK